MKKITLFFFCIMQVALIHVLNAQTIDFTKDGRHYYIASPNGRYFTGTVNEGPGCFFDAETKKHMNTEEDSVLIFAVNNDGIACGALVGQPGVWVRGEEWKMLTVLETINDKPITGGEIIGMSYDATKFIALMYYDQKSIPVYFELDNFENWDKEDSWKFRTLPTPDKEDLLYNMAPAFVQICGMNYDATRILGRYRLVDGKREVPFIWQKEGDDWTIRFVAERSLLIEDVVNGTIPMPDRSEYTDVTEYDLFRQSVEKGIILDLSPFSLVSWSGKGRYIPVSANVLKDDGTSVYHAAVIDIDKDTLIVFTAVSDAGSVSVNDKGEVMIYTPHMTTFRDSYVATIDNPTEAISLLEYTRKRSNGKIDLSEHMTYQISEDFDGNPVYKTATGSAVWANEGNAFVTYNYDEWNETLVPQCFFVRFADEVATEDVENNQFIFYPNPTSGVIYLEQQLENVVVYDVTGSKVYVQSRSEQSLDLSHLNVGTYILTAQSKGETLKTKVMIKY